MESKNELSATFILVCIFKALKIIELTYESICNRIRASTQKILLLFNVRIHYPRIETWIFIYNFRNNFVKILPAVSVDLCLIAHRFGKIFSFSIWGISLFTEIRMVVRVMVMSLLFRRTLHWFCKRWVYVWGLSGLMSRIKATASFIHHWLRSPDLLPLIILHLFT